MGANLKEPQTNLRKTYVKTYVNGNVNDVATYVNLPFVNVTENFKYSIQDKQSESITIEFYKALQNLKGNGTNKKDAIGFDRLTLFASAYFFEYIFGENLENGFKKHHTTDSDYTIKAIKGYFDACNLTNFTPTTSLTSEYKKLVKTSLFDACYLVIQSAYHYGTSFLNHQFLDYMEHYILTSEKLPTDLYKYDKKYLEKKYQDIDLDKKNKSKEFFQTVKAFKKNWYFSTQELILNHLGIENDNFKKQKQEHHRLYNSLAQCPRTLRTEQPFLLVSFDISSAYPSMIDEEVGSNLGKSIYDNLANKKGISRSEAKTLFNRALNSKEYRKTIDKKEPFFAMLLDCGYSKRQSLDIIYKITDNKDFTFFEFGSKLEQHYINIFNKENYNFNATRLHDCMFIIKDNTIDYSRFKINFGKNISFSFEEVNQAKENRDLKISNRKFEFNRIQFAPKKFYLSHYYIIGKLPEIKGIINEIIDVTINKDTSREETFKQRIDATFYKNDYQYISCNFDYKDIDNYDDLCEAFIFSFKTLLYLNPDYDLKLQDVRLILNRYRTLTNLCFDIETLASEVFKWSTLESFKPEIKLRDYTLNSDFKIINDFIFMAGLGIARGINSSNYNYFNLIDEVSTILKNNDFSIVDFTQRVKNIELQKLRNYINSNLCGNVRKSKNQSIELNVHPLYNCFYKGMTINTNDQQKQDLINITRKIKTNENNLKKLLKQEHNKSKVKELILYINPLADIDYKSNEHTKKAMLKDIEDLKLVIKKKTIQASETKVIPITPKLEHYNTDYRNSIFFNKLPTPEDFKNISKWKKGQYNYDFMKFHQEHTNWQLVTELIIKHKKREIRLLGKIKEAQEIFKIAV